MDNASILIVEDDADLCEAYIMILQSEGIHTLSAENGLVAYDLIKKLGDPGIIFLDLRMPVMSGIEFLKKYDAPKHKSTTVVVFSNYDAEDEVDAAFELGAKHYVLKALAAPKELLRIVHTIRKQSLA